MYLTPKPWRANTALTWCIVVSLAIASFGGLVAVASLAVGLTPWEAIVVRQVVVRPAVPSADGALQVSVVDQICLNDGDCTVVDIRCDRCGCGEVINIVAQQRYDDQLKALCQDYRGTVCSDVICPTTTPRCVNRRCTLSESPPPAAPQ